MMSKILTYILLALCLGSAAARTMETDSGDLLKQLRSLMIEKETIGTTIQVYLVPANDAHQSEFVGESERRLAFVSKFTGSTGFGIVTLNEAAIWIDSRYYVQAERQVDEKYWTIMKEGLTGVKSKTEWLLEVLKNNSSIGFDPKLLSSSEHSNMLTSLTEAGHVLVPVEKNLIDLIWDNKPPINITPLRPHELKYTGWTIKTKYDYFLNQLKDAKAEVVICSALDDIAWLFNLRADDIAYTPVFYSYAFLTKNDGLFLFLHKDRITKAIEDHFATENATDIVHIRDYDKVEEELKAYVKKTNGKIIIPTSVNYMIASNIPEKQTIKKNLVSHIKAVKTEYEAEGMKNCHIRDGAALARYFNWLEQNVDKENITELSGAAKLTEFRSQQELYVSPSFTSISAVGANAALAHYTPDETSNKCITKNEVYLLDSGGQYLDGTIDTTRTIHLGNPKDFEIECYTRVLKGYIAVHMSIFPNGASDTVFDAIARTPLWEIGLDYGHGSGHGVGSFLAVHEYPPSFSYRPDPAFPGLIKNMFTSIEPGFYKDGEFGIRIEDIIQVVPAENVRFDFGGRGAMRYEPITLVPLQAKMIDIKILTDQEISWINKYHEKVLRDVGALLKKQGHDNDYNWLKNQTVPMKREQI